MLVFDQITMRFPGVTALDGVSFEVRRGECHALLGENGAGKSTLGKILAGIHRPTSGRILLDGRPLDAATPRDAARAGVGIVHQELVFCPELSVAENLCLADLPRRGPWLDRKELRRRAEARLAAIGASIDPDRRLGELSVAQEQLAQIAAAVGQGARILVFDEPTSALGREETARLFQLIRDIQQRGATILYVSHRLEEIFQLCQRATVLRDGRLIATSSIADVTRDELVRHMVGREVTLHARQRTAPPAAPANAAGEPAYPDGTRPAARLSLRGFSSPGRFEHVDLDVGPGEIVGLAGLVGAGRSEIADAIFGLDPRATGQVLIDGQPFDRRRPSAALARGVGYVPEDRKRQGLVLSLNVRENTSLPVLERVRRFAGFISRRADAALAERYRRELAIRAPSVESSVAALSGGNQQKIVFAKGLETGRAVLIVDEPTRGVDVGAKQEIHSLIVDRARRGAGVLLISSDLPELLALSDRIVALHVGRVSARLTREEATPERVLLAMTNQGTPPAPQGVLHEDS